MSALEYALRHIERYLGRHQPKHRPQHHVIPGGSIDRRPPLPEPAPQRAPRPLPPPPPAHLRVTAEDSLVGVTPLPAIEEICGSCGQSHHQERRIAWLTRIDADKEDIIDAQPCWYGGGPRSAGERRYYRDMTALRQRRAA